MGDQRARHSRQTQPHSISFVELFHMIFSWQTVTRIGTGLEPEAGSRAASWRIQVRLRVQMKTLSCTYQTDCTGSPKGIDESVSVHTAKSDTVQVSRRLVHGRSKRKPVSKGSPLPVCTRKKRRFSHDLVLWLQKDAGTFSSPAQSALSGCP